MDYVKRKAEQAKQEFVDHLTKAVQRMEYNAPDTRSRINARRRMRRGTKAEHTQQHHGEQRQHLFSFLSAWQPKKPRRRAGDGLKRNRHATPVETTTDLLEAQCEPPRRKEHQEHQDNSHPWSVTAKNSPFPELVEGNGSIKKNIHAFPLNEALPNPTLKRRTARQKGAKQATKLGASTRLFKQLHKQSGASPKPKLQHLLLHWLSTGQLFSFVLFLSALGSFIYLFVSPHFSIQHVTVEGNAFVSQDKITTLSGIQDTSIWFVNSKKVAHALKENPYIEHVKVRLALPNRAIIRVSERQPEVRWSVGNVHYFVDSTGRVLDVADTPPEEDALVIVDTSSKMLFPDDRVDPDALGLVRALSFRLPQEVGITPSRIGWDIGLGVYIKTNTHQTIVFGQNVYLDRKLAILHHLLEEETGFTFLDLRPSNPFYRNDQQSVTKMDELCNQLSLA